MSAPRRVLWVDATAGASGDMILGALIDLGVPLARVREALRSLPIEGWTLSSRRVTRGAMAARHVRVGVRGDVPARTWRDVARIVRAGKLGAGVEAGALAIFRRLFEAEAEVHGDSPDRVHLHEAGAIDAIVDVVGAAVGLAHIAPDRVVVSRLTTGEGEVVCAHGRLPVPAPATLALIEGVPVTSGAADGERLTPTGAAILTTVADAWGGMPAMTPAKVGCGAGSREFSDRPNLLRMVIGEADATVPVGGEIAVLECTVDDANPQVLAYAVEQLRESGALDAFVTPAITKKNRAGQVVTVLCRPGDVAGLASTMFRETPTLGIRHRIEHRLELDRDIRRVRTAHGLIRVKVARLDGREVQVWPEYDDCAAAARRRKIPLDTVQRDAIRAYRRKRGGRKEP